MSDEQIQVSWPTDNGINESYAIATCRDILLDTTVIGRSCLDSIGNQTSSADIVQACIGDVQVSL